MLARSRSCQEWHFPDIQVADASPGFDARTSNLFYWIYTLALILDRSTAAGLLALLAPRNRLVADSGKGVKPWMDDSWGRFFRFTILDSKVEGFFFVLIFSLCLADGICVWR